MIDQPHARVGRDQLVDLGQARAAIAAGIVHVDRDGDVALRIARDHARPRRRTPPRGSRRPACRSRAPAAAAIASGITSGLREQIGADVARRRAAAPAARTPPAPPSSPASSSKPASIQGRVSRAPPPSAVLALVVPRGLRHHQDVLRADPVASCPAAARPSPRARRRARCACRRSGSRARRWRARCAACRPCARRRCRAGSTPRDCRRRAAPPGAAPSRPRAGWPGRRSRAARGRRWWRSAARCATASVASRNGPSAAFGSPASRMIWPCSSRI